MSVDPYERLAEMVPTSTSRCVVVGVTGAVAVGKSTVATMLSEAVHPRSSSIMSGDGFLLSSAELMARDAWTRKGQPDTYDVEAMADALARLRNGQQVEVPAYSHLAYDRVPGEHVLVQPRDIIIVEGLHLLHDAFGAVRAEIDLSIYVDAEFSSLRTWYEQRLRRLVEEAHRTPGSFELYRSLSTDQVAAFAESTWEAINAPNIEAFIAPTRSRADIILEKGPDHSIVDIVVDRP